MYAGSPVVAVASGGPLESVKDGETGFLRPGDPPSFSQAILTLVRDPRLKASMGRAGHQHVRDKFSLDAFGATLDGIVLDVHGRGQGRRPWRAVLLLLSALVALVVGIVLVGDR
jgi:alpha-1,3/alpha-1,6-mannosyltransferase